jgi:hypothetical protein
MENPLITCVKNIHISLYKKKIQIIFHIDLETTQLKKSLKNSQTQNFLRYQFKHQT